MSFPWYPRHNGTMRRTHSAVPRRRRSLHFMIMLTLVGGRAWAAGPGPTEIPLPDTVHPFVQAGAAKWNSNTATLTQQSANVQLNWASFNVGSNATVTFNQPNASSIALNRIWDGNPSQIFGKLMANGQIYLLNRNGIVFGPTAQINVGSLVASTLDITQAAIANDIGTAINSNGQPAFAPYTDSQGNLQPSGRIDVQQGADLRGKQIFMFASQVTNAGHIETTDGQAILAAGNKIYLIQSSAAPSQGAGFASGDFNGYVVVVDTSNVPDADLQNFLKGQTPALPAGNGAGTGKNGGLSCDTGASACVTAVDTITNLGQIIANHGNATLIGLAVNQNGRVSATTTVRVNGSIRLVAQDASASISNTGVISAQTNRTGAVVLGTNSVTEVTPDLSDTSTDIDGDPQPRSNVRIDARTIYMDQGARITATSGDVHLTAHDPQVISSADDSWVYLAAGSQIDVSGAQVSLPMESNVLQVQLRGPELQDSPLQRDGFLYGQTIAVDLRRRGTRADGTTWIGTPLVDLSSDVANIGHTVAERSMTGGTVTIDSGGSAVIGTGAGINLSGGVIHYSDGYVKTSKLLSGGMAYDIANASPDLHYTGFADTFTVKHNKWGLSQSWTVFGGDKGSFERSYDQGMDAGTLTLIGPQLVLNGAVHADSVIGPYQRGTPSVLAPGEVRPPDQMPLGARLVVGDATVTGTDPDFRAPDVMFSSSESPSSRSFNPATGAFPADLSALYLSPDLMRNGVSRVAVYSNGRIDLPADVSLNLPAGGGLSLTGGVITIDGQVRAPGGSVNLAVKPTAAIPSDNLLTVGEGARLDVSGSWVNDSLPTSASPAPTLINGGSVSITNAQGDVDLLPGSVLDVSGGAWLQANGKIKNGNGGNISLGVQPIVSGTGTPVTLDLRGTLRGYALGKGGTLNVTADGICIGLSCADGVTGQINLDPGFFSRGGFANYKLTSNLNNLEILSDATIMPRAESLILDPTAAVQPTGSDLSSFSHSAVLPDALRSPVNLEFDVAPNSIAGVTNASFNQLGVLTMDTGARVMVDPGASVSFNSSTRMYVDGTVDAPAGSLSFTLGTGLQQTEYIPSQNLWFGPHAQLTARGVVQEQPNARGLHLGQVLPGGTISIDAQRGYIVAQSGATIDVSGAAAPLDLSRPGSIVETTTIVSDAGTVNFTAAEGVLFDGTLRGQAGGAGAAGGSFSLTLDPQLIGVEPQNVTGIPFPTNTRKIILADDGAGTTIPIGITPGDPVPGTLNGLASVNGAALVRGGFDVLTLRSRNLDTTNRAPITTVPGEIDVQSPSGKLSLTLGRSLTLDAASLAAPGTQVGLTAPYVAVGNSVNSAVGQTTPTTPMSGDGTLTLHGQLIDVLGNSVTQNIKTVTLDSSGDIRLNGVQQDQGRTLTGSFTTAGDINLRAAQVYPTTLSSFTLQSQGKIQFKSQGQATPVLEGGGRLIVKAPNIDQGGVVKSPLGEIDFNAGQNLTLEPGSITSTSAEGQLIPFGQLQSDFAWVYQLGSQTLAFSETDDLPQKRVSLAAPDINVASGATIDISGGGDFFAYQFNPNVLGSKDLLSTALTPNTYAILPGLNPRYAPYDPQEYAGSTLKPGDSVYLAGGIPGLSPGSYALLPARYALLPGAYLVTAVSGYQDLVPGQRASLLDGTPVVAGYRTVAGTDIQDARSSGFAVMLGSSILTQASYTTQNASRFFTNLASTNGTAAPRLPQDAGVVAIQAQQSLILEGTLRAAATGRGAAVDISANQIEVVQQAGVGQAAAGVLQLGADQLNAFGAESLLLGATRTDTSAGTELSVGAADVTVDTGVSLHAPELMLAANGAINVGSGSQLTATGTSSGTPGDILIGSAASSGNGALLRLSAGAQARVVRQNYDGTAGVLNIQDGATLKADGSMILDATRDLQSRGTLLDNGSLTLGAAKVSLGDAPAGTSGLVLDNAAIAGLGNLQDLALRSYSSLDLYGDVALNLKSVSLQTGEIAGYGASGTQATLRTTGDLSWSNPNAAYRDAPTGQGSLFLHGNRVVLGDGSYAARGFSNVTIEADQEIVGQGTGKLNVAGMLTMSAPRVTGAAKSDTQIAAVDDNGSTPVYFPIEIRSNGSTDTLPPPSLGARLSLEGASIAQYGRIDLPSGVLALAAKGADATTGSVVLASGSTTSVAGSTKDFGDVKSFAPGGSVTLTSDNGDVAVQSGAGLSVAGGVGGGDAGTLTVIASKGTAQLDGQIDGTAQAGYTGGSVSLDIDKLDINARSDFSALNGVLSHAGFTDAITLRQRNGNVAIGAGDVVTAQNVELSADTGGIDVRGTVNASGVKGGSVTLSAQNDINLQGATIEANATGAGQDGGRVALNTSAGGILMDWNSTINVAGGGADPTTGAVGVNGQVALRLPQASVLSVLSAAGNSRLSLAGKVIGSARTTVEGFKTYDYSPTGQIGTADTTASSSNPLYADASAFMSNATAVMQALQQTGSEFHVAPGIEIDSNGDLALNSTWDFLNWKINGEAGGLTLRAAGNLNINSNNKLSDNFNGANLQNGNSWSYRLVAGSDFTGASPLALSQPDQLAAGKGNFTLQAGTATAQTAVRTGQADIDIAAAGDIVLGNQDSVIYTAGNAIQGVPLLALGNRPYPAGKSDISLYAQGDIQGAVSKQLFTGWLYRAGRFATTQAPSATGWTIAFDSFEQGIGALAGGNVDVRAGGSINDLSVSIPTIGRQEGGDLPAQSQVNILGGGDLRVDAGGDIASGIFYTGRGKMIVRAGDSLISDRSVLVGTPQPIYTVLGLGNSQADVTARADLTLQTILNPTLVFQDSKQNTNPIRTTSFFSTYAPDSGVRLTAVGGDVTLSNNRDALASSLSLKYSSNIFATEMLSVYPPLLEASALSGNVDIQDSMTLFPAPTGNLALLANGSVLLESGPNGSQVVLSDADPNLLPSPSNPGLDYTNVAYALRSSKTTRVNNPIPVHANVPVHADQNQPDGQPDTTPARVIALTGNVAIENTGATTTLFEFAKPAEISAGRDVRDLRLIAQNLHASDETRVTAGHDVVYTLGRDALGNIAQNPSEVVVGGPGRLTVQAGRNIDLGASDGISTLGNTANPALPAGGADVTVLAGTASGIDYAGFIQRYFITGSGYTDQLTGYMRSLTGDGSLTEAMALQAFLALPPAQQQPMILGAFYSELRTSGEAASKSSNKDDYNRGFDAIHTLFPGGNYAGNLRLFFSKIYTFAGGDINLVVPGGLINAGLSSPPTSFGLSDDSGKLLGVVAASTGNVQTYSYGDFAVNASRVFAADGGDIMLWSSTGNIDAGRGSKTAISAPPPTVTFNNSGQLITSFPPSLQGSGIRGLVTTPGRAKGTVDLFAPVGAVNAGDAGIGSAGNLNIAAQQVIGADNIQVGGRASGVPSVDVGSLSASLAGIGNVAAAASKVGEEATQNLGNQSNDGFLGVEVTGFGDQ